MNNVLGIDLGTTYSCVAWIDGSGKPAVLKNAEGELTTPSVVFLEAPNRVVVGTPAKESAKLYPDDVVACAKRSMGQPGAGWHIHGLHRTPEEVSSYILKKIVSDAVEALRAENKLGPGETITDVVITCPAYFGVGEREATRRAGEIAGLRVLSIINEPTAAAIAYGALDNGDSQVVLVYDLGGGTFDVTMIDVSPGAIRVICTGGDQNLGGSLWDERILRFLAEEFTRQTGRPENILEDPDTLQELILSAERAKRMLSARERAPISVNYRGERVRVELSRQQFDLLTSDLLDRTISLTRDMLEEAGKKGYSPGRVGEVLLVGGSSRMPQVARRLGELVSAPVKIYDPDESVAKGAALYAQRQSYFNGLLEARAPQDTVASGGQGSAVPEKQGEFGWEDYADAHLSAGEVPPSARMNIVNVASRSFGTVAFEHVAAGRAEVLYHLILKNTELPATGTNRFYTVTPGQRSVEIRVLESASSEQIADPGLGTPIGETVLELPEGLPAGSPLEIQFRLNEDGLLELHAVDLEGKRDVHARFQTVDALSGEALEEAKRRLESAMFL